MLFPDGAAAFAGFSGSEPVQTGFSPPFGSGGARFPGEGFPGKEFVAAGAVGEKGCPRFAPMPDKIPMWPFGDFFPVEKGGIPPNLLFRAMEISRPVIKAITAKPERVQEADADTAIVRQVQAGNVEAFDRLILKYRQRLYSVIYNLTSNREDTADLTQETFIKAFQSINRFKGRSTFFAWIYRIAVNSAYSHLRRNKLRRFFSFETIDEDLAPREILDALTSKSDVPRERVLKELQEKLNEALQTLSLKHRTVVVLFEIESLSHQEIAEIMGCTVGTVRSRLHYAKQQLQGKLQPYLT